MAEQMTRKARFIGKDTRLGRQILEEPRYARYRPWLGKEVEVDLGTAEFLLNSAIETRVRITVLDITCDTEMVRSAHVSGLTAADLEVMYRAALDRRFPTKRQPVKTGRKKRMEVAPPM